MHPPLCDNKRRDIMLLWPFWDVSLFFFFLIESDWEKNRTTASCLNREMSNCLPVRLSCDCGWQLVLRHNCNVKLLEFTNQEYRVTITSLSTVKPTCKLFRVFVFKPSRHKREAFLDVYRDFCYNVNFARGVSTWAMTSATLRLTGHLRGLKEQRHLGRCSQDQPMSQRSWLTSPSG